MRSAVPIRNLKALIVVALMVFGIFTVIGPGQAAHAQAARPDNCVSSTMAVYSRYEDTRFNTEGDGSCGLYFPTAKGFVDPCNGSRVTTNADIWLSQATVPGSKRLVESGRTGYVTWTADCKSHQLTAVTGWNLYYTTPLWACGWYEDADTGEAWDYVCSAAY